MKYREFGKTGMKVSVVGMGTYFDPIWIALAMLFRYQSKRKTILEALETGLEGGINFIDTAELYHSETIVADAISNRKRDELFIATKVWSSHLREESLIKSCKRSLERLRTPYVDLYQIHFPNSSVAIVETMGAMEKLVDKGLVRSIGVSNFSLTQMLDAEKALRKYPLISNQMNYNLTERDVERDILPHCETERIALVPYFPLAHGKLSRATVLNGIASSRAQGERWTASQVALKWLVEKSPLIFPIPRASNPIHVGDNVKCADLELNSEEMRRIEDAYPRTN